MTFNHELLGELCMLFVVIHFSGVAMDVDVDVDVGVGVEGVEGVDREGVSPLGVVLVGLELEPVMLCLADLIMTAAIVPTVICTSVSRLALLVMM